MTHAGAFVVAVTGHRPNRLAIGEARARHRLEAVLHALRHGLARGSRRPLVALTALAEGADRLFAEAALHLGCQLQVVLPFAEADYVTTFAETSTTSQFRTLLARAGEVEVLPGRLTDTKAAYEAVGRHCVDRCRVLVAVWDGKPAAGRGGTPEIAAYAASRGKPVVWIDAAGDRSSRLLASPGAVDERALMRIAARAKPVGRAALVRLTP